MKTFNLTRRVKAFTIHFSLSALAFFIVLYFILLHWYPKPHFAVNGGWQGVRVLLFVYFFSGPFLTLLLYKPLKSARAILFDLVCVIILQISVFTWGVYAIHVQRPVGLSLYEGVVYPIIQKELVPQEKTPADLKLLDDSNNPPVVFARNAVTADEQGGVTLFEFVEAIPEAKLYFLFDPIEKHVDQLFAASLENTSSPPEQFTEIRASYLKQYGYRDDELAFVPFEGRYGYALLVFNRSGKIIDAIPDPRHTD
ncbi:MAG: hypothetical protein ACRESK_03580 [Gammaproteobacteria bacterium]